MAIILTQTDTNAACGPAAGCSGATLAGGASAKEATEGGTPGVTEVSVGIANLATEAAVMFNSAAGEPGLTSWDAGTWTIRLNITSSEMNATWEEVWVCRFSSGCSNLATVGSTTGLGISLGTTGVKTASVTGSAQSAGAGDVIYIVLVFTSSSAHGNQSVNFTPDQNIDTPINPPAFDNIAWARQYPDNLHPEQMVERRSFFFLGLPNDIREGILLPMWFRDKDPERPHPEQMVERRSALADPITTNAVREGVSPDMWFRDKDPERPHPEEMVERRSHVVVGLPNDIREGIVPAMWLRDKDPDRPHPEHLVERRSLVAAQLIAPNDILEGIISSEWAPVLADRSQAPRHLAADWLAFLELTGGAPPPVLLDFLPVAPEAQRPIRPSMDWLALVYLVSGPAPVSLDFLPVVLERLGIPRSLESIVVEPRELPPAEILWLGPAAHVDDLLAVTRELFIWKDGRTLYVKNGGVLIRLD